LNNQRQVNLSWQLAREAGGRLYGPEMTNWFGTSFGRPELGWICPSAPVVPGLTNALMGDLGWGTVRSAWTNRLKGIPWMFYDATYVWPEGLVGSYGINEWLKPWSATPSRYHFVSDSDVEKPSATPLLMDSVGPCTFPAAWAVPATDLFNGWTFPDVTEDAMNPITIPRHGRRPTPVPTHWPISRPLPGAINVAFVDGHGELVPLEALWQLYWHKEYVPPAKRPGLP
jgi:prepilin-type processing-associated H-X9-DG protein